MAARSRKVRHDDETRRRIQTSQLINRLENHVLSNSEMSSTQLRAAEVLLRKTLPDVSAVEMTGEDNGPIKMVIEWANSESQSTTNPDDNS
jgi:hypothetical protein